MQNSLLDTVIMTPKIYGIDKITVMADFMKPQPNFHTKRYFMPPPNMQVLRVRIR